MLRATCFFAHKPRLLTRLTCRPCRLPAGEDGCVCAYDAQRCYMPTTFVLTGFPLHASGMSVSADGQLLAVAALSLRPGSTGPPARGPVSPAKGKAGASAAASLALPVIVLHSTLSMQPLLQVPAEGGSRLSQVQLLPDGRHVLALTDSGRLLGYSCSQGSLVLDAPACLGSPALAWALDPTASFLAAGTASGQLKVWGLQALHSLGPTVGAPNDGGGNGQSQEQHAVAPAVIRSLPCQELDGPAGSRVQGVAFLDSQRLLTAGSAGEVCCWSFHGEPAIASSAGWQPVDVSTSRILVVQPREGGTAACRVASHPAHGVQAPAAGQHAAASLIDRLRAARSSQQLATPAGEAENQEPAYTTPAMPAPSRPTSPASRSLPAALQACLPQQRPPSAPAALHRQQDLPAAIIVAAADRLQSASLPATQQRGRRKQLPIWERYKKVPEASLVVTATPGERCAKVVRQERRLRVSSPAKQGGRGGPGGLGCPGTKRQPAEQRTAEWVDAEAEDDRVPAYRPSQQLQLLPPSATVQRVMGFEAAASFCWLPEGPLQASGQELLYAAGNVLVAEDMGSVRQRHLARLPRDVSALAATADGRLAAAAVHPATAEGSSADIHLVQLQGERPGAELPVLCHHSRAVQVRT